MVLLYLFDEERICKSCNPDSEKYPRKWWRDFRLVAVCEWLGYDETTLAIGLGFTCHLVAMISNYLDIPLRYPMLHRGSRSLIYDHIMDKLSDSERELVLCVCIPDTDVCCFLWFTFVFFLQHARCPTDKKYVF